MIIAVHTFATVCFGKRMSTPVVLITTICGWYVLYSSFFLCSTSDPPFQVHPCFNEPYWGGRAPE